LPPALPGSSAPSRIAAASRWHARDRKEIAVTTEQDAQQYIHRAAVDAEGNRFGKISQVYLDEKTGQPLWLMLETGLFGTRQSFAPIHGARLDGEQLAVLAVSKDQVKDSPNIDKDAQISDSEQDALRSYYRGYLGPAEEPGDQQ
jgi:hypothetical protein